MISHVLHLIWKEKNSVVNSADDWRNAEIFGNAIKYCVLLNAILFCLLNKCKSEVDSYSLYATVEFNEQYEAQAFVRDHDDQREKGSEFTK